MAAPGELNSYSATFLNGKGKKIFCKYWEPDHKPRALVFIAHGFAEHCLPYDVLAKKLAERGFFVFSHDHVGHGQSGGAKVHVDSFQQYIEDVLQHVQMVKEKYRDSSVFLCGHSMGGAISIMSALQKPGAFKGLVLVAPAVVVNADAVTPFKIYAARFLRWLFPHFPIGAIDYSTACSCPKGLKIIKEDPLRWHGFVKAGFGFCLIEALKEIQESLNATTFPFAIFQGEDDKICDPSGATRMYEKSPSIDKMLKMYPKAYHCLLLEPNGIADQVMQDIVEWFDERA